MANMQPTPDDKQKIEMMYRQVRDLMSKSQWQQALQILKNLLHAPVPNKRQLALDTVACLNNFGIQLLENGKRDEALACYHEALKLDPMNSSVVNNIGNLFKAERNYDEAIKAYRQAVAFNPKNVLAFCNLGHCYHCIGEYQAERVCYDEALRLDANHSLTHWNLSLNLLLLKQYHEGWKEYEWRFKHVDFFKVDDYFFQTYWDGSQLGPSKSIMVYTEQGFGDCIQFIRFITLVKEQSKARILFCCKPTFHRLLKNQPGIDEIYDINKEVPSYDAHVPLLSIPYVFNLSLDDIKASNKCPYISVDKKLASEWKKKIKSPSKFKIGVCWGGSPTNKLDHTRSVDFKLFWPLIELPNVEIYNLQVDREPFFGDRYYDNFIDLTDQITDFADTAALVQQMDMVVSIETAVAHLAGALGKPTWILLSCYPAWRWHLENDENEWYPSVRLFRQTKPHDWHSVMQDILSALKEQYKRKLK